jgi:hypothetical protein
VADTTTLEAPAPHGAGAVSGGDEPDDCMYCGRPLAGENDGWAHKRCEEVVKTDRAATEIHDNGPLEKVERKLRRKGRCPYQIRAPGWDGGGIYCGRDITEHGDEPNLYCLEHECTVWGDDDGAAQERAEHTLELLGEEA